MSFETFSEVSGYEWRTAVNDVAEELLALPSWMAIPEHPVADRLKERGPLPALDLKKAEFYAPARVACYLLANEMIEGEGAAARFAHQPAPAKQHAFDELLSSNMNKAMQDIFLWRQGRVSRFDDFDRAAFRHSYRDLRRFAIRKGGCLSYELTEFGILTRNLLQRHEKTRHADRDERVAIAHELASIIPGRATVNVNAILHLKHLSYYRDVGDMRIVGGKHQLIDGRSGRPLRPTHANVENIGPTLKCPAHWNGTLHKFVAAGVNLLADLGCYD